jgi:Fe-Mn family superoxide dismutase
MKNLVNQIQKLEQQIIVENVKKNYQKQEKYFLTEMRKIGIDKLPYPYTALKRFIDPETMDTHYNKHYKGYVDKLNAALSQSKFGDLELENIVQSIKKYNKTIHNNAGGAFNHALFWKMLSPKQIKPEKFEIFKKIIKEFGNFRNFTKKFESEAKERFGSGWVWLVLTKKGKLKIMSTTNQDNPLMNTIEDGGYPLLGLDLWEHAYYLKYKNRRDDYIRNFWKVVNWEFVDKLYQIKKETKINESHFLENIKKKYNILNEQKIGDQMCSTSENNQIKKLLFPPTELIRNNYLYGKFKKDFVKGWTELLKTQYSDKWKEKDSLFIGHEAGIYDENNDRSILMNLTSSYITFCMILKGLNSVLNYENIQPIVFTEDPENNLKELKRFFDNLTRLRSRFFSEKSKTFTNVIKKLKYNDCLGRRNEDATKKIIDDKFGEGSCEIISGMGLSKDMIKGIDANLSFGNINGTAQIKPFTSTIENNDRVRVLGTSSTKNYDKVTYMVFVNIDSKTVKIFKTQNMTIEGNVYILPKTNEVLSYSSNSEIEFLNCDDYR